MSLTATYNGDLARVQLAADSLGATAVTATVERSLNETLWTFIRGGTNLPVADQESDDLSDYEWFDAAPNFYRIRSFNVDGALQAEFTDSVTPNLADQVWLKSLPFPSLNRPVTVVEFSEIGRASRSSLFPVKGRSVPVGVHDQRLSQVFTLELMTSTLALARDLDLILVAGGPFFVHVPVGCPVPGGYVSIADSSQARRTRSARSPRRYTTLPCTVEAAPLPEVVGTTLTWGTVERLYGSWPAVDASNPTWRPLLATIGSVEDPVIL